MLSVFCWHQIGCCQSKWDSHPSRLRVPWEPGVSVLPVMCSYCPVLYGPTARVSRPPLYWGEYGKYPWMPADKCFGATPPFPPMHFWLVLSGLSRIRQNIVWPPNVWVAGPDSVLHTIFLSVCMVTVIGRVWVPFVSHPQNWGLQTAKLSPKQNMVYRSQEWMFWLLSECFEVTLLFQCQFACYEVINSMQQAI